MKFLLGIVLLVIAVQASPIAKTAYNQDPENYKDPRWALIPNDEGNMMLSDLQVVHDPEPLFNAQTDVVLLLFTRTNPLVGQRVFLTAESIAASNFNANHPVRILIHGWTGSFTAPSNILSTAAFLRNGDFNVIVADWGLGAQTINYITARNRVGDVGAFVAQFVDFLHLQSLTQFSQVAVAGHSLGGHAAGFVGKHVTRGRIQSIIGLDQAGPLFSLANPDTRMDIGDAIYTEGIITNGGTLGFFEPILHATFYPNGGRSQPGCGTDIAGTCAHDRAHEYFAESINSNTFWSTRCESFAQIQANNCVSTGPSSTMGGEPSNSPGTNGVFSLVTNGASPFSLG